jgi:hypothetical protein
VVSTLFYDVLARLDARSFLGLQVWEFSLRSLVRSYGSTFLRRVVLRHPLRTLAGLLRYRRLPIGGSQGYGKRLLFDGPEEELVSRLMAAKGGLLVAVGYCQKPVAPECPAGRPNHDCVYLDRLDLDTGHQAAHPACEKCDVRSIGTLALEAGACMHVMTSALDIARDVMIPAMETRRFPTTLMCLCPFSVQVIGLPLTVCGVEGCLVGYESGNCSNYEQWLLADEGIKPARTFLDASSRAWILSSLQEIAAQRAREGVSYARFRREGNIYVPEAPELPESSKAV